MVVTVDEGGDFPELANYHANVRLLDGRPALLVDPGSARSSRGDAWEKSVANAAAKAGQKPSYAKRDRRVGVKGVGKGAQQRKYDCTHPIALRNSAGRNSAGDSVTCGFLVTPTSSDSGIPGFLGLSSLRKNRGILDCSTRQLRFCRPGDYDLQKGLPPGSDSFVLELAPPRPPGAAML